MGLNLSLVLTESAKRYPDRPAVKMGPQAISYRELDGLSDRAAGFFRAEGIRPGDRVALMLPNVPQFPVAYFGALKVGATVVPMNVLLKEREVSHVLADSGAKVLVAWEDFLDEAEGGARAAGLGGLVVAAGGAGAVDQSSFDASVRAAEPIADSVQRGPDDVAVILYTSGTTGRPKGARLTNSGMLWTVATGAERILRLTEKDVVFGALPFFHVFGQNGVMNAALYAGACVALVPRFDPESALGLLGREGVTVFEGVPTMYAALVRAGSAEDRHLPMLRLGVSSGQAMDPGTLRAFEERFGCRVLEAYGLTETCATAAANQPDRPSRPGSIGTPSWGVEMRIVDGDLKELSAGEVGEITVRGLNLMDGYHGNPEATAEAITPDGWFLTGDLGRTDEEGCFYVVDRKKDLIIRGGYNVYPREVEDVLYGHPDVVHVCVLGVPHPELGEEVAAAVVPRPGARPDPEELKAFAREHLAAFKYPRVVALFEQLPVGPTGKVLRRAVDKDELLCRAAGGAVGSEGSPDQQGQGRGR